jgi:hypothetical protein
MGRESIFGSVEWPIMRQFVVSVWEEAEAASNARHAAQDCGNVDAAGEFGRLKIAAIQRVMSIAPTCFRVREHYVNDRPHFSVRCKVTNRSLHVPIWVRLPEIPSRSELSVAFA